MVRDLETLKVLHAEPLKSEHVKLVESKKLSGDYVIVREVSGGSCCLVIHAFQTKPTFKKVLRHINNNFDSSELIVGKTKLELHKEPFISISLKSHVQLEYNPAIFDLETGDWD